MKTTFVPKSVKAIAMLFFAISKFGETARHLTPKSNESERCTISIKQTQIPEILEKIKQRNSRGKSRTASDN